MAETLTESSTFTATIQMPTSGEAISAADLRDKEVQRLANRTRYLKDHVDTAEADIAALEAEDDVITARLATGYARYSVDSGSYSTGIYFQFSAIFASSSPRTLIYSGTHTGAGTGEHIIIGDGTSGAIGVWRIAMNLVCSTDAVDEFAEVELISHTGTDPTTSGTVVAKWTSMYSVEPTFTRAIIYGEYTFRISAQTPTQKLSIRVASAGTPAIVVSTSDVHYKTITITQISRE